LSEAAGRPRHPVAVLVAGDLETATGGFLYTKQMIMALSRTSHLDALICLPDRFPHGDAEALRLAEYAITDLPAGTCLIVDGLAFTALAAIIAARGDLQPVALIHHPLCDETGLSDGARRAWFEAERAALSIARHVIVSSETTRRRLADFGVEPDRVSVVRPGVCPPPRGGRRYPLPGRCEPLTLLTVANLIPRKGQDLLVTALKRLDRRRWRLSLVGPARDAAYARRLRGLVQRLKLGERITITGEVPSGRLTALFAAADLFVLPSHHEGFGIALLEALAHGVPVLTTSAGAITEAVPAGTGVFVAPGHLPALTNALIKLVGSDRNRLAGLRQRALAAAPHCRRWGEAQAEFAGVVARLSAGR
jgi:glycosyltransferase involved in cell wall biosynthesis